MNQILDYGGNDQVTSSSQEQEQNKPKTMEDYYQKPSMGNQPQMNFSGGNKDSKKTVKIFAIALGIFAIVAVIIAIGIFIVTNKRNSSLIDVPEAKPQIIIMDNEDSLEVTAEYTDILERLIYTWGEQPDTVVPGTGTNKITTSIQKPVGTQILRIKVVAQDGNEAFEEKEYSQEVGPDIEKPKVIFNVTDSKKLNITVRDNVGLKSFQYFWNDESPTEVAGAEGRTEMSTEIDLRKDTNRITVIAIDQAGNETREAKEYTGAEAPTVLLHQTTDKKMVIVTVKHPKGVAAIDYKVNGKEYKYTYEGDLIKEEVKMEITLVEGDNLIEVVVTSVDGQKGTARGTAKGPLPTGNQVLNTNTQ